MVGSQAAATGVDRSAIRDQRMNRPQPSSSDDEIAAPYCSQSVERRCTGRMKALRLGRCMRGGSRSSPPLLPPPSRLLSLGKLAKGRGQRNIVKKLHEQKRQAGPPLMILCSSMGMQKYCKAGGTRSYHGCSIGNLQSISHANIAKILQVLHRTKVEISGSSAT